MNEDTRKWLAALSFMVVLMIIVFLLISGFEIGGIEIRSGIHIDFS